MKTSLGIWALGPMVTRFVPGGLQAGEAGRDDCRTRAGAVEGLGDLIDGYEFHYPQELSEENLDEVRAPSTVMTSTRSRQASTSTRASAAAGSSRLTTRRGRRP